MSIEKLRKAVGIASTTGEIAPPQYNGQKNSDTMSLLKLKEDNDRQMITGDFPYHVFHPRIQAIINDCNKYLSYPKNFTAASILSAAAFGIGRKMRVQYLWSEGTIMYMALIAPPGTCKSHPLAFAMTPLENQDKRDYQDYRQQFQNAGDDPDNQHKLHLKKFLHSDFTIESLGEFLDKNRKGISVYVDELRGFFKNFDRYQGGSQQEQWLQNWTGAAWNTTRKGRTIYIERPNIGVVGTTQPSVIDEMGKDGRSVTGFIERFLFLIDEDVPVLKLKKRSERSSTEFSHLMGRYEPIIKRLIDIPTPKDETQDAEADEWHTLYFSEQADDAITEYINKCKTIMETMDNEYKRNIYSKIQNYAIRFSLILELLDWSCENNEFVLPQNLEVSVQTVNKAIMVADYFLRNALKANAMINLSSPVDKMPKDFRTFYRALPDSFSFGQGVDVAAKHQIGRATFSRALKRKDFFEKVRGGKESLYEKIQH